MASYTLSPAERELIASEFCLKGHAEPTVVGSNSAERLSVMDAKRSNAVSFLLAKLPELPALAQAIYQMDSKVLDADRLTAMVRLWPTPLEIDAIERHNGDVRHCPFLSVLLPVASIWSVDAFARAGSQEQRFVPDGMGWGWGDGRVATACRETSRLIGQRGTKNAD
jgi:hypothetical protein